MNQAIKCESCNAPLNLELTRNGICKCEYCGTSHNLSKEITLKCNLNDHMFSVRLYKVLSSAMNYDQLQDLTYLMSGDERISYYRLDWENIRGSVHSAKCRELVQWFNRIGCLNVLVEYLIKERPLIIFELQ